jgi:deoxyribodipyrimidine photo-lyase
VLTSIRHTDLSTAEKLIHPQVSVFWFRRDLRLDDNAGLYYALRGSKPVLPLFIFDTCILEKLDTRYDARVEFIHNTIASLQESLVKLGTSLLVLIGDPVAIFKAINPHAVYANHDYEGYAIRRDEQIRRILNTKGIKLLTYKDHVIFEKKEIEKDNGEPYTIFTPYSRKWQALLNDFYTRQYPTTKYVNNFLGTDRIAMPSLDDIGFRPSGMEFPERAIKTSLVEKYAHTREFPAMRGTSRLGIHLRFGTLSIRKLVDIALKYNDTWLKELIWRDFYAMILANFPHVEHGSFKSVFDKIQWRNNEAEFERWCNGTTGYPIVDAGMRELNATGFMHNRLRMITASFLTKHLLIDWRWGEAYFAGKLLDYDLASNNGGWQWAAGTGCDASPYFRVFNPQVQMEKFDKNLEYVRRWVPEVDDKGKYPTPIVEHSFARDRAIKSYRKALQ